MLLEKYSIILNRNDTTFTEVVCDCSALDGGNFNSADGDSASLLAYSFQHDLVKLVDGQF